ncbi:MULTISPECIES: YkvA family protein [unclassified Knoellia]|uniref:YkvA family protein n=1 Tax=Knoellia altitudinis TaxID=3404795 RepID=UPI003615DB76
MSVVDESSWSLAFAVLGGLLLFWTCLLVTLWFARPDELRLRDALRLLPDVVRLVRRLAGDSSLPRGVRLRLGILLAYLAMPIDLVPDFIPVIGYADDAVVVVVVLRSVVRRAGVAALERHWPGTPAGFAAVCRVAGLGDGGERSGRA